MQLCRWPHCKQTTNKSKGCILFSNSAVKVHDSQAYRNMGMTRERISFTFDPIDMLLFLQMGFSVIRAAVACAILERISCLESSSETTAPMYLKLVTAQLLPFYLYLSLDAIGTDLHHIPCADFVETFYLGF